MRSRISRVARVGLLTLLASAGLALAPGVVAGPFMRAAYAAPPVFTTETYDRALAQANQQKRLVLIKATADWCPPCKQMDKTTWRDEALVKWIGEKAVAVYLDVDKQPKIAESLKVEAMPTMILLKDGKEFDRVVGFQSAPQMLAWLGAAERGESRADAMRREAGERAGPDGKVDVRARMDLASDLARSSKPQDLDLATDEYVWLWNNMLKHRDSMYGVRLSFMASDMQRLGAKHPRAKAEFAKLRDAAEADLKKDAGWEAMTDWIVLNLRVLDDKDAVMAWYDRVSKQEGSGPTLARYARDLGPLLTERGRWADAGRLLKDPLATASNEISMFETPRPAPPAGMDEAERERLMKMLDTSARKSLGEEVGRLHAALRAADRDEEAGKVLAMVLDRADFPEVRSEVLKAALAAKVVAPAHLQLLEGPKAAGIDAELAAQVREAAKR